MNVSLIQPYCVACLSSDRMLVPIEDISIFTSIMLLQLPDAGKGALCWECNATVMRLVLFRQKVFKAQQILNGSVRWNNVSLSTMCQTDIVSIHFEPPTSIEPMEIKTGLVLKSETETHGSELSDPLGSPWMDHDEVDHDEVGHDEVDHDEVDHGEVDHDEVDRDEMDHDEVDQGLDEGLDEVKQEERDSDDEPLSQIRTEKTSNEILQNETIQNINLKSVTNPDANTQNAILTPLNPRPSIKEPMTLHSKVKPTDKAKQLLESEDEDRNLESEDEDRNLESDDDDRNLEFDDEDRNLEFDDDDDDVGNKNYTIKTLSEEELKESMKERLEEVKRHKSMFACEVCGEAFKVDVNMAGHMKMHDASSGAFSCRICAIRFQSEALMKKHTESHYRIYACNSCKQEFTSLSKYMEHYNNHHDPKLTKCDQCDATFHMKRNLVLHKRIHKKRVECPVCKKLVKSYILNNHLRTHERHPPLECDVCHKEYKGKHRLEAHKRNIHKQSDDGAFCVECDMRFKSMSIYKVHLERSAKHVPKNELLPCPRCERKFTCKNYLNDHIKRTHTQNSGFPCDLCKGLFVSKLALKRHVQKVHEKRIAPKDKICNICGKGFQVAKVLQQHINGHLNLRPFKCDHCGDAFTNNGARYTHIKLKHKKKEAKKPESSATDS